MNRQLRPVSHSSRWCLAAGLAVIGAVSVRPAAQGATLPDSYALPELDTGADNPVDRNLEDWLAAHSAQPSALRLAPQEFDAFTEKLDALTALYLRLARANREGSTAAARPLVEAARQELVADGSASRPRTPDHPLMPFLLLEMLRSGVLGGDGLAAAQAAFNQTAAGSCAVKATLLEQLETPRLTAASDDELLAVIGRIDSFRSASFRRQAVRRLAETLPPGRRAAVGGRVLGLAQAFPPVVAAVPWLKDLAEAKGAAADSGEARQRLDAIRKLAGKRQCSRARDDIRGVVRELKDPALIDEVITAAKAVDGCYKARDPKMRVRFWSGFIDEVAAVFGDAGWFEATLRLGSLHWAANDYAEARRIFGDVLARGAAATDGRNGTYQARAVFALARIAEQEGDFDTAAAHYRDYTARFSGEENAEDAMMALVLIHVDRQEWDAALAPLQSLISTQALKAFDQRPVGGMSFALFWSGRVRLAQGRFREAAELWRRGASEYYSTYYGAMSHYMLEQLTGRRMALQPARTPPFRLHAIREAFSPDDQRRLKRIEALLRLGLDDTALCEIEEIDTSDGRPENLLTRALFLHAAGRWLDAVKTYDALPRSYRAALPVGMERILFPRRFMEEIRELAGKAEVDPDLVLAIIRQESVFNPEARSPVGASGLMQLMPATARMESKRLSAAYATADERQQLRRQADNPRNLIDPLVNLRLGVHHVRSLMAKYGSPVYVLSAYNASPSAAQRWMTRLPTRDVLAFIERIPYKETRAYVKLVMRNYFYYKRWYGDPRDGMQHLEALTSPLLVMARQDSARAAMSANH